MERLESFWNRLNAFRALCDLMGAFGRLGRLGRLGQAVQSYMYVWYVSKHRHNSRLHLFAFWERLEAPGWSVWKRLGMFECV